jgi:hypothetical protein
MSLSGTAVCCISRDCRIDRYIDRHLATNCNIINSCQLFFPNAAKGICFRSWRELRPRVSEMPLKQHLKTIKTTILVVILWKGHLYWGHKKNSDWLAVGINGRSRIVCLLSIVVFLSSPCGLCKPAQSACLCRSLSLLSKTFLRIRHSVTRQRYGNVQR